MKLRHLLIVGFVVLSALPGFAQQSSREDFKALCQVLLGRWMVDITFITDWPGVGKRGEKTTGYTENRLSEDGHVLLGRSFGGQGSSTWIMVYDAAAKQIRESGADSAGGVWTAVYFQQDGKWAQRTSGSLHDGRKYEGRYTVTLSDHGNTQKWSGPTTVEGQKADELQDVYRRVSK